jgi:hypothetical protein
MASALRVESPGLLQVIVCDTGTFTDVSGHAKAKTVRERQIVAGVTVTNLYLAAVRRRAVPAPAL